jgi:hypothetical protein
MIETDWGDALDVRFLLGEMIGNQGYHVDVGCGRGFLMRQNSVGIDISIKSLKKVKRGQVILADGRFLPIRKLEQGYLVSLIGVLDDGSTGLRILSEAERVASIVIAQGANPYSRFYRAHAKALIDPFKMEKFGYEVKGYNPLGWTFLEQLPLRFRNFIRKRLWSGRVTICKAWVAVKRGID